MGGSLAERFKKALKESGLTKADIARQSGGKISKAALTLISDGTTKTLKGDTVMLLARLLKVRPQWLNDGQLPMREDDQAAAPAPFVTRSFPAERRQEVGRAIKRAMAKAKMSSEELSGELQCGPALVAAMLAGEDVSVWMIAETCALVRANLHDIIYAGNDLPWGDSEWLRAHNIGRRTRGVKTEVPT